MAILTSQPFLRSFVHSAQTFAVAAERKAASGFKKTVAVANDLREGLVSHRDFMNLASNSLKAAQFAGVPFTKGQISGIGLLGRFITTIDLLAPIGDVVWVADRKDWKNRSAIDWAEGSTFLVADTLCAGSVLGSWGVPLLSRAASAVGTVSLRGLVLNASLPLGISGFLSLAYLFRSANGVKQIINAKNNEQKIYGGLKSFDGAFNAALWSTIGVTALLAGTKLAVVGSVVAGLTAAAPYVLPFAFLAAAGATCSVHLYKATHKVQIEGNPQPKGHRIGDRDTSGNVKALIKNSFDNSVMVLKDFFGLTTGIDPLTKLAQGATKVATGLIKITQNVAKSPQLLNGPLVILNTAGDHVSAVVEGISGLNIIPRLHEILSGQYKRFSSAKQASRLSLTFSHGASAFIFLKSMGITVPLVFREIALGPIHLSPLRLFKDGGAAISACFNLKESHNVLSKAKADVYGTKGGKLGAIQKKDKWQQRGLLDDQGLLQHLKGKYSAEKVNAVQFSEKMAGLEAKSYSVKHEAFSKASVNDMIAVFERAKVEMVAAAGGNEANLSVGQKRLHKSFDWNVKQLQAFSNDGAGLADVYRNKAQLKTKQWADNEKALKARRSLLQKLHFGASIPYDAGKIVLCTVGIVSVLFAVTLNVYLATVVAALGVVTAAFGCVKFGMNLWKEYQFGTNDPNNRFFLPKTFLPDVPPAQTPAVA